MRKQVQVKVKVALKVAAWILIVLGGILGTVVAVIVLLVMLTIGTVIAAFHTLILGEKSPLWDVMYSDIKKVVTHFRQAFHNLLRRGPGTYMYGLGFFVPKKLFDKSLVIFIRTLLSEQGAVFSKSPGDGILSIWGVTPPPGFRRSRFLYSGKFGFLGNLIAPRRGARSCF